MSTIEKAAARLVAKSKPVSREPAVPEIEPVPVESSESDSSAVTSEGPLDSPQYVNKDVEKDVEIASTQATPSTALSNETCQTCELDFEWLAENGFLVPGHKNPAQAQEFRRIKRPLLLNQQPKLAAEYPQPTNVIFITSSLPGEGKTFVSLNLALSLAAELDKSVLLVDGDVAKRDLSRWMGIQDQPGLVDLLTEGRGYGEGTIIDTNVERLQVMSCGKGQTADNLDELYASSLMNTLIDGLAEFNRDRILIVDGPPLIATTEAAVLARKMGQVVMVVEANKTPQSAVEQAVSQLEGCQLVSMLLNKTTGSSASGYGYGYGYGYGQDQDANN